MQINYDLQADAIYIQLRQGEVDDTLNMGKYIHVDVDEEGRPLGDPIRETYTRRSARRVDKHYGQYDLNTRVRVSPSLGIRDKLQ